MMIPITRFDAIRSLVGGELAGSDDASIVNYYSGQTPPTEVEIDAELVKMNAEYDAQEYARNRASEYPTLADQLDEIFHNGIDSWKSVIKVTKDKYPK